PRAAGGDEPHRVELELVAGLVGGDEVPVVDGVERTAHDAQAPLRQLPLPATSAPVAPCFGKFPVGTVSGRVSLRRASRPAFLRNGVGYVLRGAAGIASRPSRV